MKKAVVVRRTFRVRIARKDRGRERLESVIWMDTKSTRRTEGEEGGVALSMRPWIWIMKAEEARKVE